MLGRHHEFKAKYDEPRAPMETLSSLTARPPRRRREADDAFGKILKLLKSE